MKSGAILVAALVGLTTLSGCGDRATTSSTTTSKPPALAAPAGTTTRPASTTSRPATSSTTTTTNKPATTTTKPATTTTSKAAPETEATEDAYYSNCSEAKAAGAAPLHRGDPGYRKALDRDGDGVACES